MWHTIKLRNTVPYILTCYVGTIVVTHVVCTYKKSVNNLAEMIEFQTFINNPEYVITKSWQTLKCYNYDRLYS